MRLSKKIFLMFILSLLLEFPQKLALETSNLFYFNQLHGIVSGNVKNGGTFLFL